MKKWKRARQALSLLLVAVLLLGCVQVPAFAAGPEGTDAKAEEFVTTDEPVAGVILREDETLLAAETLGSDRTLDGNYVLTEGYLDLAGQSLTINGSLLQTGGVLDVNGGRLVVTGDYRIQNRKNDGTYDVSGGVLVMNDENDNVQVGGVFYASGDTGYYDKGSQRQTDMLTAGTLVIGEGLHQLYRGNGFCARDGHKTVFAGAGENKICSVTFESDASCLGIVEMAEGADISWEGYCSIQTLGNDVAIKTASGEGEGIVLQDNDNGRMNFNSHTLTINGNVKDIHGKFYVGGADLLGEAFAPANAGSLVVNGDLLQQVGDLVADGGHVHVTGDWRIQKRSEAGTYEVCGAALVMTNANDDVQVDGDFYTSGDTGYYDRKSEWKSDILTAGTLTIGKGLHQSIRGNGFCAKDGHKTVFAGGEVSVSFESTESYLGTIATADGAKVTATGYFNAQKLDGDVTIYAASGEDGGLILSGDNGRLDFNGNALTIAGDVQNVLGKFFVGGADSKGEAFDLAKAGSLVVNGNLFQMDGDLVADGGHVHVTGDWRIQKCKDDGTYDVCSGALVMTNAHDDVRVDGSLYVSGDTGYYDRNSEWTSDILTAGTLTIGKGLHQSIRGNGFCAKDDHKTVFAGEEVSVSFESKDSYLGVIAMADGAKVTAASYFNAQKLDGDVTIYAASGEDGGLILRGDNGRLDFNGHVLTIEGNVQDVQGKFFVGGADSQGETFDPAKAGSLVFHGNLLQQEGDIIADGGHVIVTGDWRLQSLKEDGSYEACSAALVMTNANDDVQVGGDFYTSGDTGYYDRKNEWKSDILTAGTLTLSGNFYQSIRDNAFRAAGTHRTVFDGDGARAVQVTGSDSCFQVLELTQAPENYLFARVPCWSKLICQGEELTAEAFAYTGAVNAADKTVVITKWAEDAADIVLPGTINGYIVAGIGPEVFKNRTGLVSVTLPDTVTEIGERAFSGCTALSSINFPASLADIKNGAFQNCSALTKAPFQEGLATIGASAFQGCVALEGLALPKSLTAIGGEAFEDCKTLAEVRFAQGSALKEIGSSAFSRCPELTEMHLPNGLQHIDSHAFNDCSNLGKVVVPATVKEMGNQVFRGTALKSAGPIGSGADYEFSWTLAIPDYAFDYITTLTRVTLPDTIAKIGKDAFSECHALTEIALPASVTEIGEFAFSSCESLGSISFPEGITVLPRNVCYSCKSLANVVLPTTLTSIGSYAFENCGALTVLEIPDGVTSAGEEAFWNCENLAELILPDSLTEIGKNIVKKTDRLTVFVLPDSPAEEYCKANDLPCEATFGTGFTLTANVTDNAGHALTDGFTVTWYDAKDNVLGIGKKLRNVAEGTNVLCRVVLGDSLGRVYVQPDYVTVNMGSKNANVDVALAAFAKGSLAGTVKTADGSGISGAAATLRQTFNGVYEEVREAETDESGAFAFADTGVTKTSLTVSAKGYYDQTVTVTDAQLKAGEPVEIVLEKIPEDKVTLRLLVREAAAEGEEPVITELNSASDLVFGVYNSTKKQEVTDFRIQYPYLVLGGDAAEAGDVLLLSLIDGGTLTAGDIEVVLDHNRCGSAEWTFVRNGSLCLTGITGSDKQKAVFVFDKDGKCVSSGKASSAYTAKALPAGTYSAVIMERTSLLKSVDSFERFAEMGLSEGTDFVTVRSEVKNGVVTVTDGIDVPAFDESKLYFTVAENTFVTVNYQKAATGQYVTVRVRYEIDETYESRKEAVRVEIPANLGFVERSLTVGSKLSACTTVENADGTVSVTIPTNEKKGTVRFYVLPKNAGQAKVHAYLTFDKDADTVIQPIGQASIEVTKATIKVPSKTAFANITASGKTLAGSEITVYDNGIAVGKTAAKKNGSWSLDFELTEPGNYSYHEIYASVESTEYGHIETDTAKVLYNNQFIELSKVTMINTAHTDVTCEFRTVFDFLHPMGAVSSYNYWPAYPTFTFLVEFTEGDPKLLENVRVVTRNSAGESTVVPCSYDAETGLWMGTHNYKAFEEVPCAVGVRFDNMSTSLRDTTPVLSELSDGLAKETSLENSLAAKLEEDADTANTKVGNEAVSFDLTLQGQKVAEYRVEMLDFAAFNLSDWEDYVEFKDEDGEVSYSTTLFAGDAEIIETVYPASEQYARETITLVTDGNGGEPNAGAGAIELEKLAGFRFSDVGDWYNAWEKIKSLGGPLAELLGNLSGVQDYADIMNAVVKLNYNINSLQNTLNSVLKAAMDRNIKKCKCMCWYVCDCTDGCKCRQVPEEGGSENEIVCICPCKERNSFNGILKDFQDKIDSYRNKAYLLAGGTIAVNALLDYAGGKALKFAGAAGAEGVKKLYKYILKRMGTRGTRTVRKVVKGSLVVVSHEAEDYLEDKWSNFTDYVLSFLDVGKYVDDGYEELDRAILDEAIRIGDLKCCREDGDGGGGGDDGDGGDGGDGGDDGDGDGGYGGYSGFGGDDDGDVDQEVQPIADPSGYVYEAVPSNRLGGVTAAIYEYTYAIDEFGVAAEEKSEILWDAASYDQVNPQTTREDGTFGWDVPEGQWLVKFTKDGYDDADSHKDVACDAEGYLPVPPIQTEVNTAMVAKAAPEVANVAAYPEEVQFEFTQYMEIDTVNAVNVTVTANGSPVSGTIVPLDAEDNYEGTKQYASIFAYKFTSEVSGDVSIAIQNVKSYNGKALAVAYSTEQAVAPMPKKLEITGTRAILHHDSTKLTVKVLPAKAGANQTITITANSPSIASATAAEARTDANGTATFTVKGLLPGQAIFTIALAGTKLVEEVEVTVKTPPTSKNIEDYPASLAETSFVYDGTPKSPAVAIAGLTEGKDFTVSYAKNVEAGEAAATVSGAGEYTGTHTLGFTIVPADVAEAKVTGLADVTYTGEAFTPVPTVTLGGKTLAENTDYTVDYEDNTNAGTAKVLVKGLGNYTGTNVAAFEIAKATQKLSCKTSPIAVGEKAVLTVTGAKGAKFTVSSSNKSILKVGKTVQASKKFQVQALKVGTVKLTIKVGSTDNYAVTSIKVTVKVVPAATKKIQVTNLAKGLKVAWAKVTGATGYFVYCNDTLLTTITNGANSFTHTKANTNGKKYVYKIVATAATGESTLSKSAAAYRLAQPKITIAKNSAAGTIGLKWSANAKAAGYQVEYSLTKNFKKAKTMTVKKASTVTAKLTKLTKGKTYYVRVRAFKTVSKTNYFSAYSAAKAIKITK